MTDLASISCSGQGNAGNVLATISASLLGRTDWWRWLGSVAGGEGFFLALFAVGLVSSIVNGTRCIRNV